MMSMRVAACGVVGVAMTAAVLAASSGRAWAQEPGPGGAAPGVEEKVYETGGAIEAVTVYRGQALVTRVVEVPGPAGLREIIVTDLPSRVLPGSIHAESSAAVQVRSVRFRTRPVSQDVREEVRQLDTLIAGLEDDLRAVKRRQGLLTEHAALLEAMKNFVAPTSTVELTKGVLNAETLEKLTGYIRAEREKLAESELKLGRDEAKLNQELDLRRREREKVTGSSSRTVQEAVILVDKAGERGGNGAGQVRLRYLVDGASWSPSYNVRREPGKEGVTLEYYASIQQLSGEDWGDVKMTLSTATPSLVSKAPDLTPMTISLASMMEGAAQTAGPAMSKALADALQSGAKDELAYSNARKEINRQQRQIEEKRAQADKQLAGQQPETRTLTDDRFDQSLNALACDLQLLDLLSNERVARDRAPSGPGPSEGLSVTYQIAGMTDLPSRNDRQLVQILAAPMKAELWKVAVPVLTGYVYDEANVQNTSGVVLLAGPVTAYSDGAFVGNGELATIAAGESFTVGFGIDSSLRASRELIEKSDIVQGGNRVVDLTYRLRIENFGIGPAKVKVTDRLPKLSQGSRESEIRLTLLSATPSPVGGVDLGSRKDGLLKWVEEVPGGAAGEKGLALEYKFRLEYDKQMSINGLVAR
ncbi:MAG: mucoidy inhibitor MuiA family protein [Phycisphaerales bacterium]|nr:mucoidy inhibitor MuiA family protein [Phycisphaerales bacterium]